METAAEKIRTLKASNAPQAEVRAAVEACAAERIRTLKAQNAPQEEVRAAIETYVALADAPPLSGEKPTSSSSSSASPPSNGGLDIDALSSAIEDGNVEEVQKIASQFGTGLGRAGFNILMYAAANRKGSSIVQSLIAKSKFDLNARSTGKVYNFPWNEEYVLAGRVDERYTEEVTAFDEGLTAIQLSAISGSLLSFNELLRAGASLGPNTAEGRTVQQLIGLRYEPGGADSKKVLVKALLERGNAEASTEEVKVAVETKSEPTPQPNADDIYGDSESSEPPKVVMHMPEEVKGETKVETPVFLFSVKGQQGAIPQIGYGTAKMPQESIASALKLGCRHLDGALLYANQVEVGQALAASGLKRDEVFVTSKVSFFPGPGLWMYDENNLKGKEAESVDLCLKQLNVNHVDLMLLHNGIASVPEYNASMAPHMFELFNLFGEEDAVKPETLPGGESIREAVLLGLREKARLSRAKDPSKAAKEARAVREHAWKVLEQAQKDGKCTYIGVANYPNELLLEMEEYATVMPCVNQVELHPRFSRPELQKLCKEKGIILTAYGSGNSVRVEKSPVVAEIAARVHKSPLQVVLKWTIQNGVVVIPAAKQEIHIQENLDLFDFTLSEDDMAKLNGLNENHTYYWDPKPTQDTIR
jgi:diketogulonate reductase-like aldo/keto reductase